jgi:hypothetical protein
MCWKKSEPAVLHKISTNGPVGRQESNEKETSAVLSFDGGMKMDRGFVTILMAAFLVYLLSVLLNCEFKVGVDRRLGE